MASSIYAKDPPIHPLFTCQCSNCFPLPSRREHSSLPSPFSFSISSPTCFLLRMNSTFHIMICFDGSYWFACVTLLSLAFNLWTYLFSCSRCICYGVPTCIMDWLTLLLMIIRGMIFRYLVLLVGFIIMSGVFFNDIMIDELKLYLVINTRAQYCNTRIWLMH